MQIRCEDCGKSSKETIYWQCPHCGSDRGSWRCLCGEWNDVQDYHCDYCTPPDDYDYESE